VDVDVVAGLIAGLGAQAAQQDEQGGGQQGDRLHGVSWVGARAARRAWVTCCAPNVEKK
jgi:hypothetical protein